MDWLNYSHLHYFWIAAREGSITRAAALLRLAPPTVSAQINALEEALGEPLFQKSGRNLVPTEAGRLVQRYADEIFQLGKDMQRALRGADPERAPRLAVGIADVVPKSVAYRLLAPALKAGPLRLTCREDRDERLLAELAGHLLDVVISDDPPPPSARLKVHSHLLGSSPVAFFGTPALARGLRARFPKGLDDAPLLLPTEPSSLRRDLERWFDRHGLRPNIVGEFDDSALAKVFAEHGQGLFPLPVVGARDLARGRFVRAGTCDGVRARYVAVTLERRIVHPAVAALTTAARAALA